MPFPRNRTHRFFYQILQIKNSTTGHVGRTVPSRSDVLFPSLHVFTNIYPENLELTIPRHHVIMSLSQMLSLQVTHLQMFQSIKQL